MKEKIENLILRERVARMLNKNEFEQVTDEEIEGIKNILLEESINGIKTGIDINSFRFFPELESITLNGYNIKKDELILLCNCSKIINMSFMKCQFEEADFESIERMPEKISFYFCSCLPKKFPKVNSVNVSNSILDFNSIDFKQVLYMYIKDSKVFNSHDISEFDNIKIVNLDGSQLIGLKEEELIDIRVNQKCIYSHQTREQCPIDNSEIYIEDNDIEIR